MKLKKQKICIFCGIEFKTFFNQQKNCDSVCRKLKKISLYISGDGNEIFIDENNPHNKRFSKLDLGPYQNKDGTFIHGKEVHFGRDVFLFDMESCPIIRGTKEPF